MQEWYNLLQAVVDDAETIGLNLEQIEKQRSKVDSTPVISISITRLVGNARFKVADKPATVKTMPLHCDQHGVDTSSMRDCLILLGAQHGSSGSSGGSNCLHKQGARASTISNQSSKQQQLDEPNQTSFHNSSCFGNVSGWLQCGYCG